jgi:general stress protein YciG
MDCGAAAARPTLHELAAGLSERRPLLRGKPWHIRCSPVETRDNALSGDERTSEPRQEDNVAKEDRGFASMDRNKQREIASKGGKAAHQKGTAHEWTSEEAREAGRKGGMASHRRKQQQKPDGGDRADEGSQPRGGSSEVH